MPAGTVGIVGTGLMGTSAAQRLTACGLSVIVANRSPERARALAEASGCTFSPTFRELAQRSGCVLVLTSGEEGTRDAVLGSDGVLEGVEPGTVVIVASTISPGLVDELRTAAQRARALLLDAPISGRPTELSAGGVTFLVGADSEELEQVRDVLSLLGTVVHVGPVGSGAAMKLAINVVVFALLGGIAEALALASRAGVNLGTAYEALQNSAISSRFVDLRRDHFVETSAPVLFSMDAALENLQLINQTAESYGLQLPQSGANASAVAAAVSAGLGSADVTALFQALAPPLDNPEPDL